MSVDRVRKIACRLYLSKSPMPSATFLTYSTGILLVIAILVPEFLAQLRIFLLHRRLAQLPRDDVVIAPVRNVRRHRIRAAASACAATDATATALSAAALRSTAGRLTCTTSTALTTCFALPVTLSGSLPTLAPSFSV